MHGQHPEAAIGLRLSSSNVLGLLLGNHSYVGVTPSQWPTQTALTVAVGHCNVIVQAVGLKQTH